MIDKPRIDRDRVLRDERRARGVQHCYEALVRLIQNGEQLGQPVRQGEQIVIPIVPSERAAAEPGAGAPSS